MYLLGKRADQIDSYDIKRLVENQVPESKILDYKRELKIGKDKERKEFLFDVSAMHNTEGGCLVFGVEEIKDENNQNTGKPLRIVDLEIDNEDKLTLFIEDVIKGNTEPNITQLIINLVKVDNQDVLVIGIPKNLNLPTMVTFNGTDKFYKRRNSGKYSVDVYELNQMFMQNQLLKERINKFRTNRIKSVIDQKFIPNLEVGNSFFIHLIPFGFSNNQILDLSEIKQDSSITMCPMFSNAWDRMFNIDGFAAFSTSFDRQKTKSYNQLFRNGIYEVYTSDLFYKNQENFLEFDGNSFIPEVIEKIKEGLGILNKFNTETPFYVSFSFHNVKGCAINSYRSSYNYHFKQDELVFPLVQLLNYDDNIYDVLKPNFDILWQSLGYNKSPDLNR
jgi:hypothetical protein